MAYTRQDSKPVNPDPVDALPRFACAHCGAPALQRVRVPLAGALTVYVCSSGCARELRTIHDHARRLGAA